MLQQFFAISNFNFIIIYIIHKILASIKITRITFRMIFQTVFQGDKRILFFIFYFLFFQNI